jgi:hypothetical protein
MGRGTKSGRPVNSSRVRERKQKNLKTDRRGPPPITKGYGGSLAVGLKHDPTARTRLPQRDGGGKEREPGRVALVGGLTGGGGERRRGVQAAAAVLLGRPGPVALQNAVGNAGNGRCSGSSSSAMASSIGHERGNVVV